MAETNKERLNRLGIGDDPDTLFDIAEDEICEICREKTDMLGHLSPTNPACEGGWCDEAIDLWMDEEATENDD